VHARAREKTLSLSQIRIQQGFQGKTVNLWITNAVSNPVVVRVSGKTVQPVDKYRVLSPFLSDRYIFISFLFVIIGS
jgi:hypothetical protein